METDHETEHAAAATTIAEQVGTIAASAGWRGHDLRWEELIQLANGLGRDPALAHIDDQELEHRVKVQAAQLAALTCAWLELLAELTVRNIWVDQGARTPAQWLSYMVGLAPSTAREHIRVALRLRELPRIKARFAAGTLSYSKVRAITRVAVPGIEELLLSWCDHATAADMERVIRTFSRTRRAQASDPRERAASHGLDVSYEDEDTAVITIRMPVTDALAMVADAERLVELEQEQEREDAASVAPMPALLDAGDAEVAGFVDGEPVRRESVRTHRDLRRAMADVVCLAVRNAVDAGPADTSGADRTTLVVHVDAADLLAPAPINGAPSGPADHRHGAQRGDATQPDEVAQPDDVAHRPDATRSANAATPRWRAPRREVVAITDGAGRRATLRPAALRRLACEAGIVVVLHDGDGTPMDIGRRRRQLTASLRRALLARDRSCRFPGCGTTRHLHAHHVKEWSDGGRTDLGNLVLLCSHHHRFVHEYDWKVAPDGCGGFGFAPPGGDAWPQVPRPGVIWPEELRLAPPPATADDPDALRTGWGYEPRAADMDMAIAALTIELERVLPDTVLAA